MRCVTCILHKLRKCTSKRNTRQNEQYLFHFKCFVIKSFDMDYCLRQIEHGNPYPLIIDLNDDCMVIGSDVNHSLKLRYPKVSPCHAHFIKKRGGWFVRDLDSTHGTYVNSYPVGARPQKLQIGDQIGFGAKSFTEGFICALDLKKPVKKAPEVIDIVDSPVKIQPSDIGVPQQGCINGHWNGPSTSSDNCSKNYYANLHIGGTKVQLRDCFVPLIRCDSENFLSDVVQCPSMKNRLLEAKAVSRKQKSKAVADNVSRKKKAKAVANNVSRKKKTKAVSGNLSRKHEAKSVPDNVSCKHEANSVSDNVPHKQFEQHPNTSLFGENSSIDCKPNLYPYKMPECFISLVRCDSPLFFVSSNLQPPFFDSEEKLNPIVDNRCVDKIDSETFGFVSKKEKPPKQVRKVEKVIENGVSCVFGPVNRRRIISSDSSDSDTSEFSHNKIDSNIKTSSFSDSKGSFHSATSKEANKIISKSSYGTLLETFSSLSEVSQSTAKPQSCVPEVFSNHHREIEQNSAISNKLSKNSVNESCIESKDASLGYFQKDKVMTFSDVERKHRPFSETKQDSQADYDLENINSLCSEFHGYHKLSSSRFSSDVAESIGSSINASGSLGKHSFLSLSTLKHQSRLDGISSSNSIYNDSVSNHVDVSGKNQYSLNENVEKQISANNHSNSDQEYHSDSSVVSMDYEITSSVGKNSLDSLEGKKNASFDSSANFDASNSNYLTLLNSAENATIGNNGLKSLKGKKNASFDSSGITKNIKNNSSYGSNYLTLLNSTDNAVVDSSENKSSVKKIRRTLPVEALPLHKRSKKFQTERKKSLKKRVLEIHSPISNISKKKKSFSEPSSKILTDSLPTSSFKIPKTLKNLQQGKRDRKSPFISKQNDDSRMVNCSPVSDKKSSSISRYKKISISRSERLLSEMRTKDFKRRPNGKDSPKKNKVTIACESNDTPSSLKCTSNSETTCSEMVELRNVENILEDKSSYIYSIPVIVSNRIPEPCTNQIVDSNLTVLSPPCNSFLTEEVLTLAKNTLDYSDSSSFSPFCDDQLLPNSKGTNENFITKEASEIPSNPSTPSIAHILSELIRRTKDAAQISSVDNAMPCTSVSKIKEIIGVNSIPSTPKQLSVTDSDVLKVPNSVCSGKTNDLDGSSQVLQANLLPDISSNKFRDIDTVPTDPRKKLAIPCTGQLLERSSFFPQASCSSDSTGKQTFTSSTFNSPLYTPKVNPPLSSLKAKIESLVMGTNSQVIFASPTSNQLSYANNQLTSNTFNGSPTAPGAKPADIPTSESRLSTDLINQPKLPNSCPEQLPAVRQRLASTESNGKLKSVLISYMRMIKNVVNLNLKWLKEQALNNKPPPEVSKGAATLPLFFSSFDEYVSAFVPMLMLEIWKKMFDEYKMICEDELLSNKFFFIIRSYKNHKNELEMSEYSCEAVVDKRTFEPCEGNLVIMHINDVKGNCHQMLCYIYVRKTEKVNIATLNTEWNNAQNIQYENSMLCKFSVYAKLRPMMPVVNKIMNGNGVCFIKNKLILADALQNMKISPLCPAVLCPQEDVFSVNRDTSVDFTQEAAVDSLSKELRKPETTPKILLLRGPPGTGKSYIIVSLIQKLIHKKEDTKVKILLTAPTDVAVDEIACRLIKKKLNFIRFGSARHINERIRSHTLAAKAEKLKEESIKKTEQRKERLEKLQTEIAVVKITDTKCDKKLRTLIKERIALERRIFNDTNVDASKRNYQNEALHDANVILTSLGGCVDPLMSVFKPDSPLAFTCCIVDHASQCTEMDILPALAFGMSKLVLVGDPFQLNPMVNSKWTAQYGYEQSMFERFHHYFLKHQNVSPSLTLQKQYRMHSEICFFPSKQFYNNGLLTPPEVDVRYITFPFHPYIVYDISEKQVPKSSADHCANFILTICNQLLLLKKLTFSIGIIVPTREDRSPFLKNISKQKALKNVEVNTVEGFQGREKDMVLMSCASSSGIGRPSFLTCSRRFNVALTRARKCLIVCIGSTTLKQTAFWQNLIRDATDRHLYSPAISIKDITLTFLPTMSKQTT